MPKSLNTLVNEYEPLLVSHHGLLITAQAFCKKCDAVTRHAIKKGGDAAIKHDQIGLICITCEKWRCPNHDEMTALGKLAAAIVQGLIG